MVALPEKVWAYKAHATDAKSYGYALGRTCAYRDAALDTLGCTRASFLRRARIWAEFAREDFSAEARRQAEADR